MASVRNARSQFPENGWMRRHGRPYARPASRRRKPHNCRRRPEGFMTLRSRVAGTRYDPQLREPAQPPRPRMDHSCDRIMCARRLQSRRLDCTVSIAQHHCCKHRYLFKEKTNGRSQRSKTIPAGQAPGVGSFKSLRRPLFRRDVFAVSPFTLIRQFTDEVDRLFGQAPRAVDRDLDRVEPRDRGERE